MCTPLHTLVTLVVFSLVEWIFWRTPVRFCARRCTSCDFCYASFIFFKSTRRDKSLRGTFYAPFLLFTLPAAVKVVEILPRTRLVRVDFPSHAVVAFRARCGTCARRCTLWIVWWRFRSSFSTERCRSGSWFQSHAVAFLYTRPRPPFRFGYASLFIHFYTPLYICRDACSDHAVYTQL